MFHHQHLSQWRALLVCARDSTWPNIAATDDTYTLHPTIAGRTETERRNSKHITGNGDDDHGHHHNHQQHRQQAISRSNSSQRRTISLGISELWIYDIVIMMMIIMAMFTLNDEYKWSVTDYYYYYFACLCFEGAVCGIRVLCELVRVWRRWRAIECATIRKSCWIYIFVRNRWIAQVISSWGIVRSERHADNYSRILNFVCLLDARCGLLIMPFIRKTETSNIQSLLFLAVLCPFSPSSSNSNPTLGFVL